MTNRYLLTLRYDGTNYSGWQVQSNAMTVQQVLQECIVKITGQNCDVTGCSRTDAGVHADMFCCTVDTNSDIPDFKVILALNAHLPKDIAVYHCEKVSKNFHVRYDALAKQYNYNIYNSNARNPFIDRYSWHITRKLDTSLMQQAAQRIIGTHDFVAFCSAKSNVIAKKSSTVRTVQKCSIVKNNDLITMEITANGFLYNMIRIIMGTIVEIGDNKRDINNIEEAFESLERKKAGVTAPAKGLTLKHVYY